MSIETQQSAVLVREMSEPSLLARVFAGISDPTRLHIVLVLLEGERNVGELVSLIGASQGRVSMHLQCLRWCGFVEGQRRGKYVYYRVRDGRVRELIALAQDFATSYHQELTSCTVLASEARRIENEAR